MQILVFGTVMYIIFVYTYYLPFLNCLIVMELKPKNRSIKSSKLIFQWLHIPIHQPSVCLSVRPPFYIIIEQNNNWSLYPLSSFPDKSHTCFPRVGRIGGAGCALAPHLLWIYRVRYVFGKYHFFNSCGTPTKICFRLTCKQGGWNWEFRVCSGCFSIPIIWGFIE